MENDAQVRLVFAGELLPGFAPDEVKRRFGLLFKLEGERLDAVFSGQRTVLKRALSQPDAEPYVAKLQKLGMRVHTEPLPVAPAAPMVAPAPAPDAAPALAPTPTPTPAPAPAPALAPTLAPLEEEIVCPTCGERQSKRVLCRSCATDMPRGIAAKKEDADRAREERRNAQRGGRYAPPTAELGMAGYEATEEPPPMLGLGFSGRMGRLTYFNAGAVAMGGVALMGIAAAVLVPITRSFLLFIPFGLFLIVFLIWAVRVSVLRLHDFNRSGWWALLTGIPYFGSLVSLVLLFWPGTQGDNDYGAQPRRGNAVVATVLGVLFVVMLIVSMSAYRGYVKRARVRAETPTQAQTQADPELLRQAPEHLGSPAAIDAFDDYARERNAKAFASSDSGAFAWESGKASPREAAKAALSACDEKRKPYTSACTLVNVNGAWVAAR